jgi:hypothetical protein
VLPIPKLLPFPQLAVDYNRDMNGADLCAQLWSYYSTANHRHRRNRWPLLWGLLDGMVANTAKICQRLGSKLTHRDIQLYLAYYYLHNPANRLRKRACSASIYGARPTKIPTQEGHHTWGLTTAWGVKRGNCQGCARPKGRPWPSRALGEISGNRRVRSRLELNRIAPDEAVASSPSGRDRIASGLSRQRGASRLILADPRFSRS